MAEEGLIESELACQQAESYAPVPLEGGGEAPAASEKQFLTRRTGAAVVAALFAGAALYGSGKLAPRSMQAAVAPAAETALISESGMMCEADGSTNCHTSKCCQEPNQFCFEKNRYWAACRESCVKGKHYLDPEEHRTDWSCRPLGGSKPPCDQKVRLLSHHKKFLTAEKEDNLIKADREHGSDWEEFKVKCVGDGLVALKTFHKGFLSINPYKETIHASADKIDAWEKFTWVEHSDGTISLQAHTGYWMKASDKGEARADAPRVNDWEKFAVIKEKDFDHPEYGCSKCGEGYCEVAENNPVSGKTCCKCKGDGKCSDSVDFSGVDNGRCSADPTAPEEIDCAKDGSENCMESKCCQKSSERCFEKNNHWAGCLESCVPGLHELDPKQHRTPWSCAPLGGGKAPVNQRIWLQSFHKRYLVTEQDHTVKADRHNAGGWEKFTVRDMGNGAVALKSYHGKFIRVQPDVSTIRADADKKDKWETFQWVDNRDGTYSLQAHTGKWLRATPEGGLMADASKIDDWEKFTVSMVP